MFSPHHHLEGPAINIRVFKCLMYMFVLGILAALGWIWIFQDQSDSFDRSTMNEHGKQLEMLSLNSKGLLKKRSLSRNDHSEWNTTVILISIDGFKPEYLERKETSTLNWIASDGFLGPIMIPQFPSLTFPNHFSLVTGVYPDIHGIVNNEFYDPPTNDSFSYHSPRQNLSKWWTHEPIWNTVRRNRKCSAVSFWPGSDATINDQSPTYFKPFMSNYSNVEHMRDVLTWLDLPSPTRPVFIAAYIRTVDLACHRYGTDSWQINMALKEVDNSFRYLVEGLIQRSIYDKIHIVIVSDHGGSNVDRSKVIFLDKILDMSKIFRVDCGPVAAVRPKSDTDIPLIMELLRDHSKNETLFKVYDRSRLLEHNYGRNLRVSPIILVCQHGYYFTLEGLKEKIPRGAHGYDVNSKDMGALFIARGPRIQTNVTIEPFQNLEVYPLVMDLLDMEKVPGNYTGDLSKKLLIPIKKHGS